MSHTTLCTHEGSVTSLEAGWRFRLLTTGRDQKVSLWDLASRRQLSEKEFPFWARAAGVSPDGQYAALLHERVSLVRLPELTIVPGQPLYRTTSRPEPDGYRKGTGQNLAFSPDGKYILSPGSTTAR
jgi:WD40 repeat protein